MFSWDLDWVSWSFGSLNYQYDWHLRLKAPCLANLCSSRYAYVIHVFWAGCLAIQFASKAELAPIQSSYVCWAALTGGEFWLWDLKARLVVSEACPQSRIISIKLLQDWCLKAPLIFIFTSSIIYLMPLFKCEDGYFGWNDFCLNGESGKFRVVKVHCENGKILPFMRVFSKMSGFDCHNCYTICLRSKNEGFCSLWYH